MITVDLNGIFPFIENLTAHTEAIREAEEKIRAHPMSGWQKLPYTWNAEMSSRLQKTARRIREMSPVLVVAGAGGSSLGARALTSVFGDEAIDICYTGDNLSGIGMSRLLKKLAGRDFTVAAASKSGTTLETLAALRVLLAELRNRYGGGAYERLIVTTEPRETPLRRFAEEHGCEIFEIPEDVGGRYSVMTAAGILPAAAAGADIDAFMAGALEEAESGGANAAAMAQARTALYDAGFCNEIFACFEPSLELFGAWWRQLFGESEGKAGGGAFPSVVMYTGDLHSMGQYIQEGKRNLYETVVSFNETDGAVTVPPGMFDDGLDVLTGRGFADINRHAQSAVAEAHISGGVPVIRVSVPRADEKSAGALMYFFETVCALSCFLRGVDPFDQPGVEAYKIRVKKSLGL